MISFQNQTIFRTNRHRLEMTMKRSAWGINFTPPISFAVWRGLTVVCLREYRKANKRHVDWTVDWMSYNFTDCQIKTCFACMERNNCQLVPDEKKQSYRNRNDKIYPLNLGLGDITFTQSFNASSIWSVYLYNVTSRRSVKSALERYYHRARTERMDVWAAPKKCYLTIGSRYQR